MKKLLLPSSILLNLILIVVLVSTAWRQREEITRWYLRKNHSAQIAMLGDSHTEIPDWNQLLSRRDVWEIGKWGYTSEQILNYVKEIDAHSKPRYCFVLAGTNDVLLPRYDSTYTLGNYRQIANSIRLRNVTPVFQTVPYVLDQPNTNSRIDSLNASLKHFCQTAKIDLIDLNPLLATNHNLSKEMQKDGLHLNEKGYQVWAEAIKSYLDTHGLR